ncbi:MAG: hypothetical protein A2Z58_03755 [Planctomycetes bacterium RIFCSPHIGHO2_12_42_15]|nr:MAG: hypothetical protein A2Z58_03755 [Planctomycetes bacterium RIFCSPHIGHO2_12_42_15]
MELPNLVLAGVRVKGMGISFRLYTLSLPDGRGKKVDCEEMVETNSPCSYRRLIISVLFFVIDSWK